MIRHRAGRRRSSIARKVGFASALVVGLCALLALPAFGFASRITRTVIVPQLGERSVTATCPKGEHVAFGGVTGEFKPPPKTTGHPSVFPTSMHRTAADRWTASGQSETVGTGSRLSAIAYCDRGAAPRVASSTVRLAGFGAETATATCPSGTVVVGDGYSSGSSSAHLEYIGQLERKSPTQLAVTMVNVVKSATTITGIAYCGTGPAPTEYRKTITLAGHKGGTARVTCPPHTSLVFGGVDVSPPIGTSGNFSAVAPFSWTAQSRTQWVVTGYNIGNVGGGSLTAIAYCR